MIQFLSEYKHARGGATGLTDPCKAPGGVICEVGVSDNLPYRRIYGAFSIFNASGTFRIRFSALYQNREVFWIESDQSVNMLSSGADAWGSFATAYAQAAPRAWLPFAIECQPQGLGYASQMQPPADSVRSVYNYYDGIEYTHAIVTCSPFNTIGRWDKIRCVLSSPVNPSGISHSLTNGVFGASDFFIACHSQSVP